MGSAVIDVVPPAVKDRAIARFSFGEVQSEKILAPAPNGSEGLSSVTLWVTEAG
ncbi:hypothetical protein [Arthrobacter sp. H41]|uniref:hypothetical protein n=1 Tax=Arthrobacter sp. H41 TaxID=1312978 RepID=UPI0004B92E20|nr:hypothetical protein [Arthrobacter sp. H41]